jgi:hypothetical protein
MFSNRMRILKSRFTLIVENLSGVRRTAAACRHRDLLRESSVLNLLTCSRTDWDTGQYATNPIPQYCYQRMSAGWTGWARLQTKITRCHIGQD